MKAVVALGANLEDPKVAVELAIALLEQSTNLIASSSLYSTVPVGGPPQPDYINAVCIIESELPARDLLDLLHGIEKSMGRVREERWGPRVIDLDLITYGDLLMDGEDLTLPHPRAHERRFVLEPWLEIDPEAQLPLHGRVSDILERMQVIDHLSQLRRAELGSIAFVPTMGALHQGHAALIEQARQFSESVLVSIFVNPLQFDDPADLEKYPRTPELDTQIARESGARVLWCPKYDEIYPGPIERIGAGDVGALYEGAMRKGHFEGMLSVVKRLFDLVQPTWALFGEKDFQQLFLVRKMVEELGLPIQIVSVPTVREASGLAISSRNVRLSAHERQIALVISRALTNASLMGSVELMKQEMDATLASEPGFRPEYAVIIDEYDFSLATDATVAKRALIAGWVNGVRLIDNMSMTGETR